nr:protein RALF-like 24 [Ipomoea batatas]GMD65805.1 protein RALF-like 24 [Ipomoea batatas]
MKKALAGKILGHKMLKTQQHFKPFITILLSLLFLNSQLSLCGGASVMGLNPVKGSDFDVMVKRGCVGKSNECTAMAVEEEEMDSESNRRVLLMRKRYISYETLRRDLVPCDMPGASYYNCKGPGKANTYNRGCEIITRCARAVNGINS